MHNPNRAAPSPRRRASEQYGEAVGGPAIFPGEADARRLIQELELGRIELEMQNEELQRAQHELKTSWSQIDQRVVARTALLTQAIESLFLEVQARFQAEQSLLGTFTELEALRDRLRAENACLRQQLERSHPHELTGASPAMAGLRCRIEAAAAQEAPVLLLGEAGAGKGVAARAIHSLSARRQRPMMTVSCAELPADRLEATLFSQVELAAQGTLFVDEIGALPWELQTRLADAVQRLGCPSPGCRPEVKIIAASNRELEREVSQGRFRKDLYARLGSPAITVPPLRQRREDIPALAAHFVAWFNRTLGRSVAAVPEPVLAHLMARPWPGNVRELKGAIERAVITSLGSSLELG